MSTRCNTHRSPGNIEPQLVLAASGLPGHGPAVHSSHRIGARTKAGRSRTPEKFKAIQVGKGLRYGFDGIVKRIKKILASSGRIGINVIEVVTKGFQDRKNYSALRRDNGKALYEIEYAIGLRIVLVIETIQIYLRDDRHSLVLIDYIGRGQVALLTQRRLFVQDVQTKVLPFELSEPYRVNVLHHQIPNGQHGTLRSGFEQFQEQDPLQITRRIRRHILRELTELVYSSVVGVLNGHAQYLVGLQGLIQ